MFLLRLNNCYAERGCASQLSWIRFLYMQITQKIGSRVIVQLGIVLAELKIEKNVQR